MKIEEMKAGRELDALVAEKVMNDKGITYYAILTKYGKEISQAATTFHADGLMRSLLGASRYEKRIRYIPYSTDIAAAWQVVEKMHLADPMAIIHISNGDGDSMDIDIIPGGVMSPLKLAHSKIENGTFEDFPLAICLAALKAIE